MSDETKQNDNRDYRLYVPYSETRDTGIVLSTKRPSSRYDQRQ
jgi:hypothetical protein